MSSKNADQETLKLMQEMEFEAIFEEEGRDKYQKCFEKTDQTMVKRWSLKLQLVGS